MNGGILEIHRRRYHVVTPPAGWVDVVKCEGEEDEECAECETQIETRRGEEVEAAPPAEVALADEVLEEEADYAPRQVVERRGRRDRSRTAEDDRRD